MSEPIYDLDEKAQPTFLASLTPGLAQAEVSTGVPVPR